MHFIRGKKYYFLKLTDVGLVLVEFQHQAELGHLEPRLAGEDLDVLDVVGEAEDVRQDVNQEKLVTGRREAGIYFHCQFCELVPYFGFVLRKF